MSKLAVFSPQIGSVSETFIKRHVLDLCPGNLVAVSFLENTDPRAWEAGCPTYYMHGRRPPIRDLVRRKMGLDPIPGLSGVLEFLGGHGVDVILGEYLDASHGLFLATKRRGIRFFPHAHGIDISARLRESSWVRKYRDYADADGVISMSAHSKSLLENVGIPGSKIHVVPYGVEVPEAEPETRPASAGLRCLAVGRMVPKKAPLVTLAAFEAASRAVPSIQLDFVGTGPLLDAASSFVRERGLGDRVRLHGAMVHSDVMKLMGSADVFLQHSVVDPVSGDTEGLPVGILEAMARGLPVVSTLHAGIPEAVQEGGTGFLVREGDADAMAERIVHLARHDDQRLALGAAGWRRARDLFTWQGERDSLRRLLGLPPIGPLAPRA